uniref:MSP domain-containing protein n=1 Tax=Steinernema glaseri TaxID=37863 RepID=A0A1I8A9V6_9BILA
MPVHFTQEAHGKLVFLGDLVRQVFKERCWPINHKDHWAVVYERTAQTGEHENVEPLVNLFQVHMCSPGNKYQIVFYPTKDPNLEKKSFHVAAIRKESPVATPKAVHVVEPIRAQPPPLPPRPTFTAALGGQIVPLKHCGNAGKISVPPLSAVRVAPIGVHTSPFPAHEESQQPKGESTKVCIIRIESEGEDITSQVFNIGPKSPTVNARLRQIHHEYRSCFRKSDHYVVASVKVFNQAARSYDFLDLTETHAFEEGETYLFSYGEHKIPPTKTLCSVIVSSPSRQFSVTCKFISTVWKSSGQSKDLSIKSPFTVATLVHKAASYMQSSITRMHSPKLQVSVVQTKPVRKELKYNDRLEEGAAFEITFVAEGMHCKNANKFEITVKPEGAGTKSAKEKPRPAQPDNQSPKPVAQSSPSTNIHAKAPKHYQQRVTKKAKKPTQKTGPNCVSTQLSSLTLSEDNNMISYTAVEQMHTSPEQKIRLQLECPKTGCTKEDRWWRCIVCKSAVFYGFDDHFYCDCGKLKVGNVMFKCSAHNNYVPHEETFLLLMRLRMTPRVTI